MALATDARPATLYTIRHITNDGTAVYSMCRMWVYSSTSAATEARIVESDKGDILSPKYAPEITAPAMSGSGAPSAVAVPIMATPMVPADPHEVPVKDDIRTVARKAVSARCCGLTRRTPQ